MPADPENLITVIMPVYNGETYLERALESLHHQREDLKSRMEILAVDDGSNDHSPEILDAWSRRLPLRILRREGGSNWMAATNAGMKEARGTWIGFLHQDDVWHPERLQVLADRIKTHPEASLFAHPVTMINPEDRRVGRWRSPWPNETTIQAPQALTQYATQNFLAIPAPLFKRSLLDSTDPLREDLWFLADWEFWLRLLHAAGGIYWIGMPLAGFRIHPASQTAVRSGNEEDLHFQFGEIRKLVTRLLPGGHPRLKASLLNEDLTITLANWSHGQQGTPFRCLRDFITLGPGGMYQFLKETRLRERVSSRIGIFGRRGT